MGEIGMVLFKRRIQDNLQDYLNDYDGFENCKIDIRDIIKENGMRAAVIVKRPDSNIAPTIYLDEYYKKFVEDSHSLESVLEEIAEAAVEGYRSYSFELDFENILKNKDLIVCELVNTGWNKGMLKNVPHREYEDLSLIYRIRITDAAGCTGTILVTNDIAERMGMDETQLYEASSDNVRYLCVSMAEMLAELTGLEPEEPGIPGMEMYVLTNEQKTYGAAAITSAEAMEEVMEKLGTKDIIVLPSSTHEVIILPGDAYSPELSDMVREINRTQVQPNERLSDNVYRYNAENGLSLIKDSQGDKGKTHCMPDAQR